MMIFNHFNLFRKLKRKTASRLSRWILKEDFDVIPKWLVRHAAQCPRCAKMLSGYNRVAISMELIKSAPHSRSLWENANRQALEFMAYKLRTTKQAHELRNVVIKPSRWAKLAGAWQPLVKAAACVLLILMVKMSVFSTLLKIQDTGQKFADRHYEKYSEYLGEITDESL